MGLWLLSVAAMIFAMAVIGAITRLTESGLSIMEWAPISGTLPPMSESEWERLFALYKTIPEYQQINRGMSLAEFKEIFWWEWIHRLWGRLIGAVFAGGFLILLLRGKVRRQLTPHLVAMFALGGLQGLLGWYMVASGFAERTDVEFAQTGGGGIQLSTLDDAPFVEDEVFSGPAGKLMAGGPVLRAGMVPCI